MCLVGVRRFVLALSVASVVCLFGHFYVFGQDAQPKPDDQATADSAKDEAKASKAKPSKGQAEACATSPPELRHARRRRDPTHPQIKVLGTRQIGASLLRTVRVRCLL
jgi:hypothetical protein